MGDTFVFGGGLLLMSSHRTIFSKPPCTFSADSCWAYFIASGCIVDTWGPISAAAVIYLSVQFFPVSAGHPSLACSMGIGAAGCSAAEFIGYVSPRSDGGVGWFESCKNTTFGIVCSVWNLVHNSRFLLLVESSLSLCSW